MHDNRSQPPFKRLLFRKIGIGIVAGCFAGCVLLLAASADASELLPKYSEHQNLTYYLDADGGKIPVKTTQDWEKRKAHILAHMQSVMGPLPKPSKPVPLKVEVLEEVAVGSLTRQLISYHTDSLDRRVSAYLFLPKKTKAKVPAVLCLHQTTRIGKREPAGLGGKPNLHYALHLAKRGYVTLAPDYPSFGDYKYDFTPMQGYLYLSGTMKAIYDNVRAVDVLQSLKSVDPERIGCIGHSLGGHNTMFTAAFEPRIKVMVSNCGFTRFHKYYNGRLKGWTSTRYMPLINTRYHNDPNQVPFDFTEIVASFAPRPFLASSPLRDSNFEVSGVRDVIAAVKPIYRLYGKAENLAANYPDCPHDFPPDARQVAYRFLDKHLRHTPTATAGGEEASGIEKGGVPIRPTRVRETSPEEAQAKAVRNSRQAYFIYTAALTKNDKVLRMRQFDLVRRKVWLNPAGNSQPVNAIQWASADKILVSGAEKVRMWQMPEGRQTAVLHASKKPMTRVDGLDVSSDGRFVVASTYEASRDLMDRMAFVTLYDVAKRKAIYRKRQNDWPVFGASFSENDQAIAYVCFASPDNLDIAPGFIDGLRVRTVANRKLKRSIPVKWPIYVRFSVGGSLVAVDGFVDEDDKGSELLIFDLRNGRNIGRVQNPNARVTALSVTEDGKRVIIGDGDGTVEYRDAPKFARAIKIHAHNAAVQSVVADARSRLVATIGRKDGVLRLWDDSTGERRGEIRPKSKIVSAAFADEHDQIACGHRNGVITIWQFASRSADPNE